MATSTSFTVMSANLWNLNEPLEKRMRTFSDMIADLRPDVIAMQEVRPLPGSVAQLQLDLVPALADYQIHYAVATAWTGGAEGLAIATRRPAAEARAYRLPDGEPDFEPTRAVQYVRIPWQGGFLGVLNTHLAYHHTSEPLRLKQVAFVGELVADLAATRPGDALVVCGDLNATPDSAPVELLESLGGLDNPWRELAANRHSYAASNPYVGDDPDQDSWLDYILTRGLGPVTARLLDDWPGGPASDHHFVLLEFGPGEA